MSVEPAKQKAAAKTLTLWNFFTIGFGAIIGTGWIFLVGEWLIISGGPIPAMLAFLLGALLLLPVGAVFGELTSALPIDGGVIEYVDRSYGKTAAFITGWFLLLSNIIMCPWETIAISTLLGTLFGDLFPWLRSVRLYSILGADVYLFPALIALCLSGFIIRQNLHGSKAAAKAQSFLTKALLAGLLLALLSAFDKGRLANWQPLFLAVNAATAQTQAASFGTGVLALLTVTPFFYTGFDTIPQQAEEAAQGLDWHKFGRIISLALLSAGSFYIICIAAFSSLMPWTNFIKQPLAALACLKHINFTLYFLMLCITVLGALGPMNSFYASSSRILLAMARKKQLPAAFIPADAAQPIAGPTHLLLSSGIMLAPFLGGNMLLPLTNVAALTFMFSCLMVCLACYKMRSSEPALHRPYKVPGGKTGIFCACCISFLIIASMLLPGTAASLSKTEYLLLSDWAALGLLVKSLLLYKNKKDCR